MTDSKIVLDSRAAAVVNTRDKDDWDLSGMEFGEFTLAFRGPDKVWIALRSKHELDEAGLWNELSEKPVGKWSTIKTHFAQWGDFLVEYEEDQLLKDDDVIPYYQFLRFLYKAYLRDSYCLGTIFDMIPHGQGSNALKFTMTQIAAGKIKASKRGTEFKVTDRDIDNSKVITFSSNKSQFRFYLNQENYKILASTSNRQGANTRKLLNFLLTKANEQHFNPTITFDLEELVSRGIYKNKDTAFRGAKKCIDELRTYEVECAAIQGKKEIANVKDYLFYSRKITYGTCNVTTNPNYLPSLCGQYYTPFPRWAYQLPGKAFILADYIYSMARQTRCQDSISKKGSFNMSFKAIAAHLGLPEPEDTHKHKEYIVDPILQAIEEIKATSKNEIKLTPVFDHDHRNAQDFLKGFLTVEVEEDVKNYQKTLKGKRDAKKGALKKPEDDPSNKQ